MLKLKSQKGFTIVELLIVIVVIGILAALVLNTFSGVQRRARDTQRQTDMNSLATQLEVYYNDRGSYPALADLQNAAWIQNNLKGLDAGALTVPNGTGNNLGSDDTPGTTAYGYVTVPAACGSPTTNANPPVTQTPTPAACTSFTLYWEKEDGGAGAQQKKSLN